MSEPRITALEWNGRDWPSGFADRWTCTRCGRVYAGATTGKPPARCLCPDDGAIVFTIPAPKPEPLVPLSAIRALVQQWREHVELCEQKIETYRDWERNKELAAIWNEQRYSFTVCADQLAALCPAPPEDRK